MNIRQVRTVGCLTAFMLVLGTVGFAPALANAKEPDPLFTADNYPRVDGVQSAQPLGLGYLREFTGEDVSSSDVIFHSENDAYSHLIQGNADLILAAAPTTEETAQANQAGVELQTIPVAQSRLIILTDASNPVDSLTVSQLKDIYSGAITDWSQVGGISGPITAYQRVNGSGSQTGMLDLVMKGTPMMDPPTGVARWMGTVAQTVTNFTPTPGALGFAYSYYVSAVWPDLVRDGSADGVKVLRVNGISPDPSIQNYPLTTTYNIVMKASEPKNSPVRTLANQMVSPHGQSVASAAGYVPVGQTDLPDPAPVPSSSAAVSASPSVLSSSPSAMPASPSASASVATSSAQPSASQTYVVNPLTVSTKVGYVRADSGDLASCALVERATIQGLANAGLQTSLMTEFASRQDAFLMQTWGTDRLIAASSCAGNAVPDIVLRTFTTANFSNVLSLVSSWGVPGSPGAHDPAATLNVRLDNGQELTFADIFTPDTNIADLIQSQALSSDPKASEQEILSWVDDYGNEPSQEFSFSAASATLYLPGVTNGEDTGITVGYASRWDHVAIFALASSASGLYSPAIQSEPSAATVQPVSPQPGSPAAEPAVEPANSVLSITSAPVTVLTDPCTGHTTTTPDTFTAEVGVVDSQGKPIPEAVVAFSATDGMMLTQQYVTADDQGVATVMAIMDQAALLRGQVPSLSATILRDGKQVPVSGSGVEVPVTISAPPVPATQPVATISDSPVPADNASSYTVSVEWIDGCGIPVAGQSVDFSASGSAQLSSDSVVLDDEGRASIEVTDPVAETVILHAEASSVDGEVGVEGLKPLVFVPAVADSLQSSVGVGETIVTIPCGEPGSTTLTAMIKDTNGHPLYLHNVYFSASGSAQISDPAPSTDIRGIASVSLTDNVPETVVVTASLDSGDEITASPLTVNFVPGCAPPSSSSVWFSVSQGSKLADGKDAYTLTIYAKDVNGGPVKGIADQFSITEESGTVHVGAITETADGAYTSLLTSAQAGSFPVRVTMGTTTQRDLAGSPQVLVFIPSWEPNLSVSVSPAASGTGSGQSYLITAAISARMGKSAPAPLVGQAPLLSVTAQDSAGNLTGAVTVGDFREVQPGVYTATATMSAPGDYGVNVTWKENSAAVITSDERRLILP